MGKPLIHLDYDWRICKKHHEKEAAERQGVQSVLEERLDGMDRALKLRTENLEFRLHVLNEAKKRSDDERDRFLQKETYNVKTAYYDEWCRGVDVRLATLETRIATWVSVMGTLFILVQLALNYWSHRG